jgi:hypothetical protein
MNLMNSFQTPDSIIGDLVAIRQEASKGVDALFAAEKDLVDSELAYDRAYSEALLGHGGTVADRQALATLACLAERERRDVARAVVARVKVKLRVLSEQQMSVQTQARMVELTWKTAGIGER